MEFPAGTIRTETVYVFDAQTGALSQCDPSTPAISVSATTGTGTLPAATYYAAIRWTGPEGTQYQTPTVSVVLSATGEISLLAGLARGGGGSTGWSLSYDVYIGDTAANMQLQAAAQTVGPYVQSVPLVAGVVAPGPSPQLRVYVGIGPALAAPGTVWTCQGDGVWQYSYAVPTAADETQVSEKTAALCGGLIDYKAVEYKIRSLVASGVGNAALTVTVTNSVTTGDVSGATVTLINSAGGVQANGTTNSSGVTVPALGAPAAVYTLAITATGYTGTSQSVTLAAGANAAAVALAPIAIPTPLSGQVTGTCYTRDGSGAIIGNKQVSFTITTLPSGQTGNALSYQPVSATSNSSGLLAVNLWASSTYNANGGGPNVVVVVPSSGPFSLPDIITN